MTKRSAGVLLHITSLPNQYLIGDLGASAYEFVDFLKQCGFKWWQVLPIGITGKNHSPYNSPSAFAGSPILLCFEFFVKQNLLKKEDLNLLKSSRSDVVNFKKTKQVKTALLKKVYKNFEKFKTPEQEDQFQNFISEESHWIHDFALFTAIQLKLKQYNWTTWPKRLRVRQNSALIKAGNSLKDEIRYHQFVQWQFFQQWNALHQYCKRKGIKLMGDIPMFVSHNSHDVWANQKIFKLYANGNPKVEAGVPPDQFAKKGQLWHMPVYNWNALLKTKYKWWIERFEISLKRFDILRLDHFIGFVRVYEVPTGSESATNGHYRPTDGMHFFAELKKTIKKLPIFVDDLGRPTQNVRKLRKKLNTPGTYVLEYNLGQFLKKGIIKDFKYKTHSVLYTTTHDHNTLQGWFAKLTSINQKILLSMFDTTAKNLHWTLIRAALKAKPQIVIIPLQDILGLGTKSRINLPGTVRGNWKWRVESNMFRSKKNIEKIKAQLKETGRFFD